MDVLEHVMIAIKFDWTDVKHQTRHMVSAHFARMAGVAFAALAMVSIEYEEVIAPSLSRVSDAWSSVTIDIGRKVVSSLAL